MTTTDSLKSKGLYVQAGANAYANDEGRAYGCHFGMKSERLRAIADFERGYDEAAAEANLSRMEEAAMRGERRAFGHLTVTCPEGEGLVFTYAGREVDRKQALGVLAVALKGAPTMTGESF